MTKRPFLSGIGASAGVAAAAMPFGMAFGAMVVEGGGAWFEAVAMSMLIFAGAAQMAGWQLAQDGAPGWVVLGVMTLINARFLMYSAAMAPKLRGVGLGQRGLLAYLLTDQGFALTTGQLPAGIDGQSVRHFYLGSSAAMWVCWLIGTSAGALIGNRVPASVPVDFAAPLIFAILAVMSVRTRTDLVTAVSACTVYLGCASLPYGLALFPAALVGVLAGRWYAHRRELL